MEKKVKPVKEIRQRKFLLVAPLLVLPFLTMIFWALGGGKAEKKETQVEVKKGFNINLPDANLKDKPMDKMSYYNQAKQDSLKLRELEKSDPNYRNTFSDADSSIAANDSFLFSDNKKGLNTSLYGIQKQSDSKTEKIYQKLAELDKEMSKPVPSSREREDDARYQPYSGKSGNNASVNSSDVERLEQMMNTMNQPASADPEMNELNGMLDKILDVQHPERVKEKLKQVSSANKGQVFVVTSKAKDNGISRLDTASEANEIINSFQSLTNTSMTENTQNAILAIIPEAQTLVDGSTVKLQLRNDIFIDGTSIPKNNFLFGIASLKGERLNIKINSIRYQNSLFPVSLSVYDLDGLEGIYIPGAITRDVAKQSADRSMQTIGLTSIDPTWQAQATGAGIEAAKTLFSKKVKLVKVQIKAGYRIFIKNEKEK
ncbi:MAG: conjugative transposon protein TraM [Bacteroidota bacterium]|nr:conjugative transposon protein TraM [Bacteroidota bacterium]